LIKLDILCGGLFVKVEELSLVRNNIRALIAHLAVSLLSFGVYFGAHISTGFIKYSNISSFEPFAGKMFFLSSLILVLAMSAYYYIGRHFLISLGGIGKNMKSVALTFYIGMGLFLLSVFFGGVNGFAVNTAFGSWEWYLLFNAYALPIVFDFGIKNWVMLLTLSMLPSFVMGLSMKIGVGKKTKKRHEG